MTIGYGGTAGKGSIENLSLSGLMLRTGMELQIGQHIGCEFSLFGAASIDLPARVVNRVGDLYGVRFEHGPISRVLVDDAIATALAAGDASIVSLHEIGGSKVMRIAGGLKGALQNDVMYSLTRVGVDEIDVSEVTTVDRAGLDLCLLAQARYGARIGRQSECFAKAWREVLSISHAMDGDR